ncbi:uncharacterized protein LOC144919061 isoform X1 [Branchiostoma floridae x Branchiostoma belcheri]
MPAVLCPEGQVPDGLPGSFNCVDCDTCNAYPDSPWCPSCLLGTESPATLVEADLSWVWAVTAVLIVAVLLITGITVYCWRRIGQKHDPNPVTVRAVKDTTMAARLVPSDAS